MAKIFITAAGLFVLAILAGCNAGGPVASTATSICGAGLDPFASVCDTVEDINDIRVEHCLQGSNVTMANCIALNNVCVNDTFSAACAAENLDDLVLAQAYFAREQHCTFSLSGGATGAGSAACASYEACADDNPFGAGCTYSGFSRARAARVSFCTAGELMAGDTGGPSDPMDDSCTMENVGGSMRSIVYCIETNPFDAACTDDDFGVAFDTVRSDFVEACVNDSTAASCGQMVGTTTQTVMNCIDNPFHADCIDNIAFNSARIQRITDCGTRTPGVNCDALSGQRVTTAVLLSSRRIAQRPDTANPRNEFLQGTDIDDTTPAGFDFGAAQASPSIDERPRVTSLNLAMASFQREAMGDDERPARTNLGGDASDGVAFFFGTVNADTNNPTSSAYAGILAGTDLGERIAKTGGKATWHGRFQTIEGTPVNTDFDLNITFKSGGGELDAFVQARADSRLHYSLNGRFNNQGIITGTITRGNFERDDDPSSLLTNDSNNFEHGLGMLQGLIGQEGAVGVFIKNNDPSPSLNFAGGFVACPLHDDGQCMNAMRDETPAPTTP